MWPLYIKGILVGLAVSAPVGPISLLCINRTLNNGFKIGITTGIGAAFADGFYGTIAAFGLTSISSFLISEQFLIRILGGIFLLYLGIKIFIDQPTSRMATALPTHNLLSAFLSGFILTLANPMTILSFIAIFASLQLGTVYTGYGNAILLVLGIICGSTLWEFGMSGSIAYFFRCKVSSKMMRLINQLSGTIIFGFGVLAFGLF